METTPTGAEGFKDADTARHTARFGSRICDGSG